MADQEQGSISPPSRLVGARSSVASFRRPGSPGVGLTRAIHDAIVAHAVAGRPNEACGLILAGGSEASGGYLRFVPVRNAAGSPHRFEMEGSDLLAVLVEADARAETVWAIVHSHPTTSAKPSIVDIGPANYPDAIYLIVSLAPGRAHPTTGEPELRAWQLTDGVAVEVDLAASWSAVIPGATNSRCGATS